MSPQTLATDNITELLLKIIEFTQTRHKVLIQNISSIHNDNYIPKDLPVEEFSGVISRALSEHAQSRRLVLRDGQNVKFGANGSFETIAVIDEQGKRLLNKDRNEYLRDQVSKLMENTLNQRVAIELLRQKQSSEPCFATRLGEGRAVAGDV